MGFPYIFYPFLTTLYRAFFIQTLILNTSTLNFHMPGTMPADRNPLDTGHHFTYYFLNPGVAGGTEVAAGTACRSCSNPSAQNGNERRGWNTFLKATHTACVSSVAWGERRCERQPRFSAHLHPPPCPRSAGHSRAPAVQSRAGAPVLAEGR